ncbi:MAG: 30S ribosomal protein S7, partial [Phycisphaerae bacterium]|nr:30S ribosomal protein S7 [Phycisphaerae bacterium]
MARKKFTASAKQLTPDPKFNSRLLAKFTNVMMLDGKKWAAQKFMYQALDVIEQRVKDATPIEVFEAAIANLKPRIEVRSKRVGGANYQVPMPVNSKRQQSLAFRWLRDAIRSGKGRATYKCVADEIIAAYKGEGTAMQTRENIHRMA